MAAGDNAVVAIEELTVHAWDLATATGQQVEFEDTSLDHVDRFLVLFGSESPPGGARSAPTGPSPTTPPAWTASSPTPAATRGGNQAVRLSELRSVSGGQ